MGVERQRPRHAAAERAGHHEVQRCDIGQLIADHRAFDHAGKMRLHPFAGHLHSFVAGKGLGAYSYTDDKKADEMVDEVRGVMDPEKREALIKRIAQYAHDNVLGGVTTYRPVITFAWRDKVDFHPWPAANWRNFQQVGLKN